MSNSSTAFKSQMVHYKDGNGAFPNVIARGTLFSAANAKLPRKHNENKILDVLGPGEIIYTGMDLRQDDEDVMLYLINEVRKKFANAVLDDSGRKFRFTFNRGSLVVSVGWSRNSSSYERLERCLTRLKASQLVVKTQNSDLETKGTAFSLIGDYWWESDEYWMELPSSFLRLYQNQFTTINLAQRRKLPTGLARWLQFYVLSHKNEWPIKIDTIARGAGLKIPITKDEFKKFRQTVRRSGKALVKEGVLDEASVAGNLFTFTKSQKSSKTDA